MEGNGVGLLKDGIPDFCWKCWEKPWNPQSKCLKKNPTWTGYSRNTFQTRNYFAVYAVTWFIQPPLSWYSYGSNTTSWMNESQLSLAIRGPLRRPKTRASKNPLSPHIYPRIPDDSGRAFWTQVLDLKGRGGTLIQYSVSCEIDGVKGDTCFRPIRGSVKSMTISTNNQKISYRVLTFSVIALSVTHKAAFQITDWNMSMKKSSRRHHKSESRDCWYPVYINKRGNPAPASTLTVCLHIQRQYEGGMFLPHAGIQPKHTHRRNHKTTITVKISNSTYIWKAFFAVFHNCCWFKSVAKRWPRYIFPVFKCITAHRIIIQVNVNYINDVTFQTKKEKLGKLDLGLT